MKLVDLPTAKALQEFGYDGEYAKMYNTSGELIDIDPLSAPYCIPVPRLDDVAYFLRDTHRINIETSYVTITHKWRLAAFNIDNKRAGSLCVVYGKDYDSALEAAVTKAIEIINSRNKSERESDENKRNRQQTIN